MDVNQIHKITIKREIHWEKLWNKIVMGTCSNKLNFTITVAQKNKKLRDIIFPCIKFI